MVKQYPHTISITTQIAATKDAQGKWVPGSETTVDKSGRYEPNSGKGYIEDAGGKRIYYSGIVYLSRPLSTLAPGVNVVVKNGTEVLLKSTVIRFSAGQLNVRIWL